MKRVSTLLAAAALTALAPAAFATPTIELFDGTTTMTCADGAGCDLSLDPGSVIWSQAIGNFILTVTTGITKPVQGTAAEPFMHLNNVAVSSSGAGGTLRVRFSETDFDLVAANVLNTSYGGVTGGQFAYTTYWDTANTLFALGNVLSTAGPAGPGPYAGAQTGGPVSDQPLSLTQQVTFVHGAGMVTSSGDFEIQAVPEPGTLFLLGTGLLAAAHAARRRRTAV